MVFLIMSIRFGSVKRVSTLTCHENKKPHTWILTHSMLQKTMFLKVHFAPLKLQRHSILGITYFFSLLSKKLHIFLLLTLHSNMQ